MNEYFLDRLVEAIPMLRRTCYRYVVDTNRADDLLQETLLKAIYNSDRYVESGKFHAWLEGPKIQCGNAAIDALAVF